LISTGNDIVALRSVNNERTSEYRFYSKILSASEQALYQQPSIAQIPFGHYVWLLWSVKESAYKYLKRSMPDLLFSPTKIVIVDISVPKNGGDDKPASLTWDSTENAGEFYTGKAVYGDSCIYFRSMISTEWIASVVNSTEDFKGVHWGIRYISHAGHAHQSKEARALLLKKISSFTPGELQIKKSPVGYPVILNQGIDTQIAASLAHDGAFVAYSSVLPS
jgi:phosphopantetheinyl transferase (holo-ACP synthase)